MEMFLDVTPHINGCLALVHKLRIKIIRLLFFLRPKRQYIIKSKKRAIFILIAIVGS